jgi:mannose-6-phosphate isomerase-like protein (cupin superfamily)
VTAEAVVVVPAGAGRVVPRRHGEHTTVKVAEAETRGAYAVRENAVPAGFGRVPMHLHREAEEAFYVLEGELTVVTREGSLAAPAGAFVLIPRGTVHAIANRGEVPVRWLTLISRRGCRAGSRRRPRRPTIWRRSRPLRPGDRRPAAGALAPRGRQPRWSAAQAASSPR